MLEMLWKQSYGKSLHGWVIISAFVYEHETSSLMYRSKKKIRAAEMGNLHGIIGIKRIHRVEEVRNAHGLKSAKMVWLMQNIW